MGTPTEDEVLAGIKRLILEENRQSLCKYMNPERYLNYLRSKFVLNEDDKDEIEYEKTRRQRASTMIDILLRKGGNAYDEFVKAIQLDKTQNDLVTFLHKEYEKRRNNYFALVRGQRPSSIKIDEGSLPKPPPPPPSATTDSGLPENHPPKNDHIPPPERGHIPPPEHGNIPSPDYDHIPPPVYQPSLSAQPGRRPDLLHIGPQRNACHDPTLSYRDRPVMPPPIRTENPIPLVVQEIYLRETHPSARQVNCPPNHPVEDTETESMKERKEHTNRQKLKFTSRSADNGEVDTAQETHRKEFFRDGEENTESFTTGSFSSSDSTKVKEIL